MTILKKTILLVLLVFIIGFRSENPIIFNRTEQVFKKSSNDFVEPVSIDVESQGWGGLSFCITEDNQSAIVAGISESYENITIPTSFNGLPIIGVMDDADNYKPMLKHINFSHARFLRFIGEYVFVETSITEVEMKNLPDLEIISEGAFYYSTEIISISLENLPSLKVIPDYFATLSVKLKNLSLANLPSLERIGNHAFSAGSLTELTLQDLPKLSIIGSEAFQGNEISRLTLENLPLLTTIVGVISTPALYSNGAFMNNEIEEIILSDLPSLDIMCLCTFLGNKINQIHINGTTQDDLGGKYWWINRHQIFHTDNNEAIYALHPIMHQGDVHGLIEIENIQNTNLIDILNQNIKINLVNEPEASFKELYNRGDASIKPVTTENLEIPSQIGIFIFEVVVRDKFGNRTAITVHIHVTDFQKPTINGKTTLETTNAAALTHDDILRDIEIIDNVDDEISLLNVIVVEDHYTSNFRKAGSHTITFSISDFSGNERLFIISINVLDVIAPTILGTQYLARDITKNFCVDDFILTLSAIDESDEDISHKIYVHQNNFIGNEIKPGTYSITFSVTDEAGNITHHILNITNYSTIPPSFIIIGDLIMVNKGQVVTIQDILDKLVDKEILKLEELLYLNYQSNWLNNSNQIGLYPMKITINDEHGNEIRTHQFIIEVKESNIIDDDIPNIPESDKKEVTQNNSNFNFIILFGVLFVIGGFVVKIIFKKPW